MSFAVCLLADRMLLRGQSSLFDCVGTIMSPAATSSLFCGNLAVGRNKQERV